MAGKKIEAELGLTGSEEEAKSIAKMQAAQRGKMARKVRPLPSLTLLRRPPLARPGPFAARLNGLPLNSGACREEGGHCRGG